MSDERAAEADSAATSANSQDWLRDVLMATERLPPAELAAYQRRSLEIMLRHAFENVPFYRNRLAPLFDGDVLRLDRWHEVPILDRQQVQANATEILAVALPANAQKTRSGTTTGSTGLPLELHFSVIGMTLAAAIDRRKLRWHGVDFNRRLAEIAVRKEDVARPPDGRVEPRWNPWGSGDRVVLALKFSTIEEQLDWLQRTQPTYLRTFPTVARALLEEADRRNVRLPLQGLITVGETVPEELREPAKPPHWPRTMDTYATTEVGAICSECAHGAYHTHVENVVLEILDEAGAPVPPGGFGKIVLTGLYNFAMPFIRYEIGDYAVAGDEPCACGLTLPTVKSIVGRQRNLFRFEGGRTIWPTTKSSIIRTFVPHRFRQIAQVGPLAVEFRYTPEAEDQVEDFEGLQAYFREAFDPRVTLTLKRVPPPERTRGQKIEDYICEI